ncbi:hypothetical protein BDR06DRAFT_138504 [Suillus hirtellus]|nr:hypothetical protein BDR06DRAFT_138504 [Suillus hirtellus]
MVLGLKLNNDANLVSYSPNETQLLIAAGTDNHIIVGNTANREELLKIEERMLTRHRRHAHGDSDTNHNKFVSLAIAQNSLLRPTARRRGPLILGYGLSKDSQLIATGCINNQDDSEGEKYYS